jgi:4-diphosphocytidyl-2-C-methyl-D-erythritol kinase
LVRVSVEQVLQGFGRNDLQPPAEAVCEEVGQAASWLHRHFGNSRMTGSGSAVFARVENIGDEDILHLPMALPPGWASKMCRGLTEHPLLGWAEDS